MYLKKENKNISYLGLLKKKRKKLTTYILKNTKKKHPYLYFEEKKNPYLYLKKKKKKKNLPILKKYIYISLYS